MALGLGQDVVPTYIVHEDLEKESTNDKVKDQERLRKQGQSNKYTFSEVGPNMNLNYF